MAHSLVFEDTDVMAGNEEQSRSLQELVNSNDAHSTQEASLENPSWEHLHEHYTKAQLQKHCRQLGLNGIWVTKEKLIDMIIDHTSSNRTPNVNDRPEVILQDDAESLSLRLEKFMMETGSKFNDMNKNLQLKDREIESLQNNLRRAEDQINGLISKLQKFESGVSNSGNEAGVTSVAKTLLLGDSSLREIKTSDLNIGSLVRTVPEANLDLLKAWVTEKLDFTVNECILYGGINDLNEKECKIEDILDDLGALVAELKIKNESIIVNICELVPALNENQDKISDYNVKLNEWCTKNGITFISTELFFKIGTGDMDINCFDYDVKSGNAELTRIGQKSNLKTVSFPLTGTTK